MFDNENWDILESELESDASEQTSEIYFRLERIKNIFDDVKPRILTEIFMIIDKTKGSNVYNESFYNELIDKLFETKKKKVKKIVQKFIEANS